MAFQKRNSRAGGKPRRALPALLLAATAIFAPLGAGVSAGDLDTTRGEESGSHFLRLGLNKSAVIKLPAEARDVVVGNPMIADAIVRTKTTAYLFAHAVGQTNVFFFDAQGQQILALDLEVSQDMTALQRLINRTLPDAKIKVDTIGEHVVLSGTAKSPETAKQALDLANQFVDKSKQGSVVSTIAVSGREQVTLKVRVAEVQRDMLKQLGINTSALFAIGKFGFSLANINPFTANTSGLISPSAGYAASYNNGCSITATFDSACGVVRAMEQDGLMRILAEPTLTAISGESAKFLAGGEFPIPVQGGVVTDPATGSVTSGIEVQFKPFGVGLGFTPVVMSEGRISLRISTEVSELTNENAIVVGTTSSSTIIPALKVRRAETTVELPSGGSMAMAGLIRDQTRQNVDGVPGLKNLPVLGALFRSRDFISNQTELVVIVTPYIVEPVNEKQLVMPTDGMAVATDRQTFLFGRLNRVYGTVAGKHPEGVYHGTVGFIVE
jgi:pilus assembly protein CpaC